MPTTLGYQAIEQMSTIYVALRTRYRSTRLCGPTGHAIGGTAPRHSGSWLSRHRENAYYSGLPSHREDVHDFRGAPDALQVDTIMRAYRPCYRRDGTAGTSAAGYLDIEKMPTTLGYHRFQNDACWLLAAGRRLSRYVFAARRIPARSRSTNLWRTSKSLDPVPREGGGNS
jgi:hypothetical protein